MSDTCLWGVTAKKPDGKYHVVNEDGEVMRKFDDIASANKWIGETPEAWEESDDR